MQTSPSSVVPVLTLYWREYCHLCHDMRDALIKLHDSLSASQGGQPVFRVEQVDVDADPELESRYDELVPVLAAGDRQICHYFLDTDALMRFLEESAGIRC